MNIDNIALVRAMDYIPFEGIIKPISHVPYLCKKSGSEFSFQLRKLLNELNITPKMDYSRNTEEGYFDSIVAEGARIEREYLPYESDYNSMVLFSINGLCPDDSEMGFGNNTFSNKKVAVIEPLKYHLEETISLVPTDTSLKGDVVLSNEAILLIEEELYQSLSFEQKNILNKNNFKIVTFNGTLKEAIKKELLSSGRYSAEDLSLSSSTGGIKPSSTSEALKECLNNIATEYGLLQMKFFNMITTNDDTLPKYSEFSKEFKNTLKVAKYFWTMFLDELLIFLNHPEMIDDVEDLYDRGYFIEKIVELIRQKGIIEYKLFVDNYNKKLEMELSNGTLPTPEEIVSNSNGRNL